MATKNRRDEGGGVPRVLLAEQPDMTVPVHSHRASQAAAQAEVLSSEQPEVLSARDAGRPSEEQPPDSRPKAALEKRPHERAAEVVAGKRATLERLKREQAEHGKRLEQLAAATASAKARARSAALAEITAGATAETVAQGREAREQLSRAFDEESEARDRTELYQEAIEALVAELGSLAERQLEETRAALVERLRTRRPQVVAELRRVAAELMLGERHAGAQLSSIGAFLEDLAGGPSALHAEVARLQAELLKEEVS